MAAYFVFILAGSDLLGTLQSQCLELLECADAHSAGTAHCFLGHRGAGAEQNRKFDATATLGTLAKDLL